VSDPRVVLFVCSGNYYRSRFAELVFNHLAVRDGGSTPFAWIADSAGLQPEHFASNPGPLSSRVIAAAAARGIDVPAPHRSPRPVAVALLENATQVIALHEPEHRPLFRARFPHWVDRVTYWKFPDVDVAPPEEILPSIEDAVTRMYRQLRESVHCGAEAEADSDSSVTLLPPPSH
jgi:low molecular weight protein-tyrosine phosphatase